MFEREQSACLQRVGAALQAERGTEGVIEILARTGLRTVKRAQASDVNGRDEVCRVLRKDLGNRDPQIPLVCTSIVPRLRMARQLVRQFKQGPSRGPSGFHHGEMTDLEAMTGRQVRLGDVLAARIDPIVQIPARQGPVRADVVVRSHELLARVELVGERGPIVDWFPAIFGVGQRVSSLTAFGSRASGGTYSGLAGSVSHVGSGTAFRTPFACARSPRRHSCETKKNSFLRPGSAGPPTVYPKLLYRSRGGVLLTSVVRARIAEERVGIQRVVAQEVIRASREPVRA